MEEARSPKWLDVTACDKNNGKSAQKTLEPGQERFQTSEKGNIDNLDQRLHIDKAVYKPGVLSGAAPRSQIQLAENLTKTVKPLLGIPG